MTNKEKLEKYLQPFLLDDTNNGKTIMLSGSWGAGKTHFWKEEIAREQEKVQRDGKKVDKYSDDEYKKGLHSQLKDKEKACIYVSLYGKTSLESIELDIYMKAYQNIVGDADFVSKTCSVFTTVGRNLGNMAHKGAGGAFTWLENLVDKDKFDKAGKYLENGGLICFDDFERKSKDIDLNDLFGFISQLVLEYKCKVVIILNSDVFTGKEAEVFRNVKEKTVNKFLYFDPSIEELFKSISDDENYKPLKDYKEDILKAIQETKELNARIYIQVLDNCLEWLKVKKTLDEKIVRVLVLGTFNFVLNHMVLDYQLIVSNHNKDGYLIDYKILSNYPYFFKGEIITQNVDLKEKYILRFNYKFEEVLNRIKNEISVKAIDIQKQKITNSYKYSETTQKEYYEWLEKNEIELKALWKYGYRLYYVSDVDEETYNEIAQFIKSGILIDV